MKTYSGTHSDEAGGQVVLVQEGERITPLKPRHDLWNHSPDGFNWGYGGSGPAQLALALLADALGNDEEAVRLHQRFKWEWVSGFDTSWDMTDEAIRAWAAQQEVA